MRTCIKRWHLLLNGKNNRNKKYEQWEIVHEITWKIKTNKELSVFKLSWSIVVHDVDDLSNENHIEMDDVSDLMLLVVDYNLLLDMHQ